MNIIESVLLKAAVLRGRRQGIVLALIGISLTILNGQSRGISHEFVGQLIDELKLVPEENA
jgi:hypothetical protein